MAVLNDTYVNGTLHASSILASTVTTSGDIYSNGGLLKSTCNGRTVTIGSQNSGWCHFATTAGNYHFNAGVFAQGPIVASDSGGNKNYYIETDGSSRIQSINIGSTSGKVGYLYKKSLKFIGDESTSNITGIIMNASDDTARAYMGFLGNCEGTNTSTKLKLNTNYGDIELHPAQHTRITSGDLYLGTSDSRIGQLNIWAKNGSWTEGIRIHASTGGWCSIALCDTSYTADSSVGDNCWSIHNNEGKFFITKAGSGEDGNKNQLFNQDNRWTIRSTNYGDCIPMLTLTSNSNPSTTWGYGLAIMAPNRSTSYTNIFNPIGTAMSTRNSAGLVFKNIGGSGSSNNGIGCEIFGVGTSWYSKFNAYTGFGREDPGYRVDVSGDIRATGSIYAGSDRRLKESIKPVDIDNFTNILSSLNIKEFNFKTQDNKSDKYVGLIAQDLRKLLPEKYKNIIVSRDDSKQHYLSINEGKFPYLLLGGIQELIKKDTKQDKEILKLKEENKLLKSKNRSLEVRMNKLEKQLEKLLEAKKKITSYIIISLIWDMGKEKYYGRA